MELQEPEFYKAMRAVMLSPSDREREVRVGRTTGSARTLVRDRDALVAEVTRLEAGVVGLWAIVEKLAD